MPALRVTGHVGRYKQPRQTRPGLWRAFIRDQKVRRVRWQARWHTRRWKEDRLAPDRTSGGTRDAYGKYEFNVSPTIRYCPPSFRGIVFYPSSWWSRGACATARPKYRSPHPGRRIADAARRGFPAASRRSRLTLSPRAKLSHRGFASARRYDLTKRRVPTAKSLKRSQVSDCWWKLDEGKWIR